MKETFVKASLYNYTFDIELIKIIVVSQLSKQMVFSIMYLVEWNCCKDVKMKFE